MKQIPLTKGQFALVDDEDYEYLIQWKWQCYENYRSKKQYATRSFITESGKATVISMHRLLLNVQGLGIHVDHINGNGLDNRRSNIRKCTHAENCRNKGAQKNSKSGTKGVFWYERYQRWMAMIRINRKGIYLGFFIDKNDAARAYNDAAIKYHGEFARLNDISDMATQ